jgi:hypothetical protein
MKSMRLITKLAKTVVHENVTGDNFVFEVEWLERETQKMADSQKINNGHGMGRELFASMRNNVLSAEEGAITWIS